MTERSWIRFDHIDIRDAARRIEGVVRRTPLEPFDTISNVISRQFGFCRRCGRRTKRI